MAATCLVLDDEIISHGQPAPPPFDRRGQLPQPTSRRLRQILTRKDTEGVELP